MQNNNENNTPSSSGGGACAAINFEWCLKFLEKRGQERYGEKFAISAKDHAIIYKLLIYFIGHEAEAKRLSLDLSKGILLSGPTGCGKTCLMALMQLVPPPERNHVMKPCREVSFEFIDEGYHIISRYSRLSYTSQYPRIYCFDDLGAEHTLKYYGNECNVMGEILLSRYDLAVVHNMRTHATTNLSAPDLEAVYGTRVRSRMREMFNLIAFPEQTPDKRR